MKLSKLIGEKKTVAKTVATILLHVITSYISFVLTQCVNSLAVKTRSVVKGSHSRKTAAFVRVSLHDYLFLKFLSVCITF